MKAGVIGSLATSSSASCSVAVTLGLAGLSKPRWLSLICTKVKSLPAASALPIRRERGTPPATVQTMAVPAQVMHLRKPRRCKFGSMLMDGLLLVRGPPSGPGCPLYRHHTGVIPAAIRNKLGGRLVWAYGSPQSGPRPCPRTTDAD